jgi:fructose-bisphosphate aldolase class II
MSDESQVSAPEEVEVEQEVSEQGEGEAAPAEEEIKEAISYGAIKMNIDTDMQWAFWDGVRKYEAKNRDFLQAQIGNPEGADSPNKKYYDPRVWLRKGEENFIKRLELAFEELNAINRN